ncbi:DinB family protein [Microlunatus sp. GCM10028923]|uniref:DinB family protein n=1 Tax=Microlunatus sp. GCM10028923 TaxID=3273400 RepID=UPI00361432D4
MTSTGAQTDLKEELWSALRGARTKIIGRLDGLSEYDLRRPLTPTGTNLLGLVKHLAGEEYGYLGESFGRPPVERPTWFRDDPYTEIDLWATPDETSAYILDTYRQACAHADATIGGLTLDSPGRVAHWGNQETTLANLMIRMIGETSAHGGHADIVRELIDGRIGGHESTDTDQWRARRAEIQAAAEEFHHDH